MLTWLSCFYLFSPWVESQFLWVALVSTQLHPDPFGADRVFRFGLLLLDLAWIGPTGWPHQDPATFLSSSTLVEAATYKQIQDPR